jgi:predicted ATP-dependent endonuclease of OLD family
VKLHKVHITEYKSIWDSQSFDVGNVTCLVGKNEAGKTSILQALYRLNPIVDRDGTFDVTDDYPRSAVEDYQQDIEAKQREEAIVTRATFKLDTDELELIEQEYGAGVLTDPVVTVSKGYAKADGKTNTLRISLPVNEQVAVKHLVASYALPSSAKDAIGTCKTLAELSERLIAAAKESDARFAAAQGEANQLQDEAAKAAALEQSKVLAESERAKKLRARLLEVLKSKTFGLHIWATILRSHFPKFLYFDEYYQMRGHDNVQALKQRKQSNTLEPSDHPLLGLIELARLDLDKLLAATRTQELKNKLQGASNHLSSQI